MLNYPVTMVKESLKRVQDNIAQAAAKSGRRPEDITLVCVIKEASAEQVKEAIACGVTDIGENRLQDALEKYNLLRKAQSAERRAQRWHFIGHLQTNKVKKAVEIFDLIHSVDSIHLAEEISKQAAKINKTQDILIQVNISGEESKFGIAPKDLKNLLSRMIKLSNINILGLMTMAPFVDDAELTRPCFRKLKQLADDFKLSVLSMGMTQDYQVAIEEGATMVRIGSAIFKNSV